MFLPIGRVEGSRTCSNKVTVPAGSEATVRGGLEVRREEIDGVLSVCNMTPPEPRGQTPQCPVRVAAPERPEEPSAIAGRVQEAAVEGLLPRNRGGETV